MSKYAAVAILVLCFVCTFLTMIYQYGSRGWKHEDNIPGGHGHTASHAAPAGHETPASHSTASPAPVVSATPEVSPTAAVSASPTP